MRRLAYLGIEPVDGYPLWVENPKPLAVYSDNGPNASEAAQLALDRVGIAPFLPPPDTPHWKPTVEGGIGNFQAKHARLSGGYARTRRARDKDARRLSKQMADKTLFEFEQKLVLQIIEYNAALNMQHMLSAEMSMDGVKGTADDIFRWGVRRTGGIQNRIVDTATVYLALLEHKADARLTKDGIRHNSAHYWCDGLRSLYERGVRSVDFIAHPRHEDEVFWIAPDGVLTQLSMDENDLLRIGKRSVVDQNMHLVHQRMQVIEQRKKGKSPALSTRQQTVLKRHDKPRRQRSAPTKHQDEYRRMEAEIDRANDTEDRTGTYVAVHAEVGGAAAPPEAQQPRGSQRAAPPASPTTPVSGSASPAATAAAAQPLPPSLHQPGYAERFSSADRWGEEEGE